MTESSQSQKQTNTGGLSKLLNLKIGTKVMLTANMDMQDCLINGQTGNFDHIECIQCTLCKVYVKFSNKQTCTRAMRSSYLERQKSSVATKKYETMILLKKGSTSPSIK